MTTLVLRPLDTLFFRDNRPFNQDDEGLAEARSMFPPFPSVLAGALRASMARAQGWDGDRQTWKNYAGRLGRGPFDSGRLRFGPPALLKRLGQESYAPYFPAPFALLARPASGAHAKQWPIAEVRMLAPGTSDFDSDLGGSCAFPELKLDRSGFEQRSDLYLSEMALRLLLEGRSITPEDNVRPRAMLMAEQPRIGLQRDYGAHIAETGALYTAVHQRLDEDVGLGVDYDWEEVGEGTGTLPQPEAVLPLGGQHRAATCEAVDLGVDPTALTPEAKLFQPVDGYYHYMVVVLSPALPGAGDGPLDLGELPGELVSACTDRPLCFGGWDARQGDRAPVERYHRAGTTLFMRVDAGEVRTPNELHGQLVTAQRRHLGCQDTRRIGCGAFAVGRWPGEEGDDDVQR